MSALQNVITGFGQSPWLFALVGFGLILLFAPIAEEMVIFTAGLLSAKAALEANALAPWMLALPACVLGMVTTDYYIFLLFKIFGRRLLKFKFFARMVPNSDSALARRGAWAVFIVRFIPGGFRNPVFALCGLSALPHLRFVLASLAGASLVVNVSFWAGYFLSSQLPPIEDMVAMLGHYARYFVLGLLALGTLYWFWRRLKSKKTH